MMMMMSKNLVQRFSSTSNRVAATIAIAITKSSSSVLSPLVVVHEQQPTSVLQQPHHQYQYQHQEQRRSFWMDVVRIKTQRGKNGGPSTMKHEDPEHVVRRHQYHREQRSDGEALIDLMFFNDKHEKAWMKRKRLQGIKRYEFDKRHVTNLAKYIAFVKDQKESTK
mmetsp:Transcript_29607/g.33945  ORF Transcript_29607/g.33945 Transcript_29607/m.33945 type:complete len:166 (+) Transcript_29607:57-554(+)